MAAPGGSNKAVLAALFANMGIAVAKFVGFLLTSSSSMLAESVHSVADSGNQGLLLLGGARAKRAASTAHPFGYGRERYFWAFVVTVVLFTLGAVFALYEGYHKLTHPEPLVSPGIAIGILVFGLIVEGFSLRTAVIESNHARGTQSWSEFIRHSKQPELPVILLEDIGAEVGMLFALIGVGLAILTGDPAWDAYGTMSIGALLAVIAVVLAIEMKSLLIGEGASPADRDAIEQTIGSSPGVVSLVHLKTQHLGPEELLVAAKFTMAADTDFADVAANIDAIEQRVRERVPTARVIYLEPAVVTAPAPPGTE